MKYPLSIIRRIKLYLLRRQLRRFDTWFHDIEVAPSIRTHSLGMNPGVNFMPIISRYPEYLWYRLTKYIPESLEGAKSIDLGCSNGYMSLELAKRGSTVIAIDISSRAIESLKFVAKHMSLDDRVKPRLLQLDRPGWADEIIEDHYDIVICSGLLYHLENPEIFIEELCRLDASIVVGETKILHQAGINRAPSYPEALRIGTTLSLRELCTQFECQPSVRKFTTYDYILPEHLHWMNPLYASLQNRVLFRADLGSKEQ